jgi:hypothetical protein
MPTGRLSFTGTGPYRLRKSMIEQSPKTAGINTISTKKGSPDKKRTKPGIRARARLFFAQGRSPMINNTRLTVDVKAKIRLFN